MNKPYDQDTDTAYKPFHEYCVIPDDILDHPIPKRPSTLHSIVSHLRGYWELYMAMIALLFLSFMLGYGYARETIVCETPTEDSSLAGCEYKDGGWYSE